MDVVDIFLIIAAWQVFLFAVLLFLRACIRVRGLFSGTSPSQNAPKNDNKLTRKDIDKLPYIQLTP